MWIDKCLVLMVIVLSQSNGYPSPGKKKHSYYLPFIGGKALFENIRSFNSHSKNQLYERTAKSYY